MQNETVVTTVRAQWLSRAMYSESTAKACEYFDFTVPTTSECKVVCHLSLVTINIFNTYINESKRHLVPHGYLVRRYGTQIYAKSTYKYAHSYIYKHNNDAHCLLYSRYLHIGDI